MVNVLIIGGGISGLTTAHELLDKGFYVTLIEKDSILGGMAKSRREKNNVPSEHSWRGFGPFYENTFDILKRIPCDEGKSAFDNLSVPIEFNLMKDTSQSVQASLSVADYTVLCYYSAKYILFGNYYDIKLVPLLENKLSKNGYEFLIEFMLGPGYGMEKQNASYGHFFRMLLLDFFSNNKLWQVSTKPTCEAWINPWRDHLVKKGLKLYTDTELLKFNKKDGKIESCLIKNGTNELTIKADEYVSCLDPFNYDKITGANTSKNTESNQISFRIGFNKKLKFPKSNIAFVMSDSEFNITWYPQEHHWDKSVKINKDIGSLWSGTILNSYTNGGLYKEKAVNLDKKRLTNEIIYQILRSKSLQDMIKKHNNFYLTENDINYTEIWYEWEYKNEKMVQSNKKWINNIFNEDSRPSQDTIFSNFYIGGSHTKTSVKIWSMEGAVESGKIVSQLVSNKYNKGGVKIYNHNFSNIRIAVLVIVLILLWLLLK